jgi:hypothetical protein
MEHPGASSVQYTYITIPGNEKTAGDFFVNSFSMPTLTLVVRVI